LGELQELGRGFNAHGVQTDVATTCVAATISIEPGHRIGGAGL